MDWYTLNTIVFHLFSHPYTKFKQKVFKNNKKQIIGLKVKPQSINTKYHKYM